MKMVTCKYLRYGGFVCLISILTSACSSKNDETKDEQIRLQNPATQQADLSDSILSNSIKNNLSLNQIATAPSQVVLTGMPQHRLVTVYKSIEGNAAGGYFKRSEYYDDYNNEYEEHFMPGIDLIHGYHLLNVAHYDLSTEKLNYLFQHPVLIKSLYYPSTVQDSLNKKPVNRDYYLISVYDADTNQDTLINKTDLRRFYYFDASCSEKLQMVPPDYSVVRSQYDPDNDVMYVFARHDADNNGVAEKKEPLHIFWINLKTPGKAKRLY